jgi:hypothetical protein
LPRDPNKPVATPSKKDGPAEISPTKSAPGTRLARQYEQQREDGDPDQGMKIKLRETGYKKETTEGPGDPPNRSLFEQIHWFIDSSVHSLGRGRPAEPESL